MVIIPALVTIFPSYLKEKAPHFDKHIITYNKFRVGNGGKKSEILATFQQTEEKTC